MSVSDDEDVAVDLIVFGLADDGFVILFANVCYETVEAGCDLIRGPVYYQSRNSLVQAHRAEINEVEGVKSGKGIESLLPTRTTVLPNIPNALIPLLLPPLPNLRTSDPLIVTVVPLADVLCDFNPGGAVGEVVAVRGRCAVGCPGEFARVDAEV